MASSTPTYDLPYPESGDPPDGPLGFRNLAEETDSNLGTIDGKVTTVNNKLTAAQKSYGRTVVFTTGGGGEFAFDYLDAGVPQYTAIPGVAASCVSPISQLMIYDITPIYITGRVMQPNGTPQGNSMVRVNVVSTGFRGW